MWVRCGDRMINLENVMYFEVVSNVLYFCSPNNNYTSVPFDNVSRAQAKFNELCELVERVSESKLPK